MSCPLSVSYKISTMLLQERGNRGAEGEGPPEGSVSKDCSEGKDDDNEQEVKPVQPKTPVLRKVCENLNVEQNLLLRRQAVNLVFSGG